MLLHINAIKAKYTDFISIKKNINCFHYHIINKLQQSTVKKPKPNLTSHVALLEVKAHETTHTIHNVRCITALKTLDTKVNKENDYRLSDW